MSSAVHRSQQVADSGRLPALADERAYLAYPAAPVDAHPSSDKAAREAQRLE